MSYTPLLETVHSILKKERERKVLSGEAFNLISILDRERNEDKTHSAFIANMLNPNGSHYMGTIFLQSFIHRLEDSCGDFKVNEKVAVYREYYVGEVDQKAVTGGRIDILLMDEDGRTLSIENKIDAGDQKNQVARYLNYNKGRNTVYYLTKHGTPPSDFSIGKNKEVSEEIVLLSYATDILDWLEECLHSVKDKPFIAYSIKQYANVLKKITHQSNSHLMEEELIEAIRKHYSAAKAVESNVKKFEEIQGRVLLEELGKGAVQKLGEEWSYHVDKDLSKHWVGFTVYKNEWKDIGPEGKFLRIKVESTASFPTSKLIYGIVAHQVNFKRDEIVNRLYEHQYFKDKNEAPRVSKSYPRYWDYLNLAPLSEREILLGSEDSVIREEKVTVLTEQLVALCKATDEALTIDLKSLRILK